jgi:hypothetical protein
MCIGCTEKEEIITNEDDNQEQLEYQSDYIETSATLDTVEIKAPGLEQEYNLLFITDCQTNFDGREDLGWFGTRETRTFRNATGDASADHLQDWVAYVNEQESVDALVMGGDIMDYFTETNANTVKSIFDTLSKPYIYTYGNHDSYIPWENRFDDDNPMFLQLFQNGDIECQALDMGEFLIVSIRDYKNDGTAQISEQALAEYREYAAVGKPIILVCHVPICTEESSSLLDTVMNDAGGTIIQYDAGDAGVVNKATLLGENMGYELDSTTREFLAEITSENSPVVAVLSGHLHENWQGNLTESMYEYVGAGAFGDCGAIVHVSAE